MTLTQTFVSKAVATMVRCPHIGKTARVIDLGEKKDNVYELELQLCDDCVQRIIDQTRKEAQDG